MMYKKLLELSTWTVVLTGALVPLVAGAQTLKDIIDSVFLRTLDLLIPIAFGIAVVVFFGAVAFYIFSEGSVEKEKDKRYILLWGIVILFVLFSIFGLIIFLENIFFGGHVDLEDLPKDLSGYEDFP